MDSDICAVGKGWVITSDTMHTPYADRRRPRPDKKAIKTRVCDAKRAPVHPLLDRSERMLDGLAAAVEDSGPRLQARRHAAERILVFKARDGATRGVGAARAQLAIAAGGGVGAIDLRHIAQLAMADRLELAPARTDMAILLRVVAELVLAEEAIANRRSALRPGHMRRQPGLPAGRDVFGAAIGDGHEIGLQCAQQPDELDVAMAFHF